MANGDAAAAAGLTVFPPTQDARQGADNDNIRGDELAEHITAGGHPWSKISAKPATFPPAAHNHDASNITSGTLPSGRVAASRVSSDGESNVQLDINSLRTGKSDTTHVHDGRYYTKSQVDGMVGGSSAADTVTPAAYGRTVTGGNFAVWMGADLQLGRNVSSRRYKAEIRTCTLDPLEVLALRPVTYRRKGDTSAPREFGLIAEEVAEHIPELVTYFDGEIDGVRYDLVAVALLDVVRDLTDRVRTLEEAARGAR